MGEVPIDRGWAWICCLGAAVNIFFVVGGLRSVGLIFIEIVEIYQSSKVITSLTVAFMAAGFAIFAPIGNALGLRLTMRRVVFIGGCLAALSAVLTSFSPSIYYVVVVYGIITGIGYGLTFGPSMVVVGMHFNERRSLANGLAAAGGSLGQLVIPQLLNVLIKEYTFRGCMLIYGALILHVLPAAMLYRPLSFYNSKAAPAVYNNAGTEPHSGKGFKDTDQFLDQKVNKLSGSKSSLHGSTSSLRYAPHQNPIDSEIEDQPQVKTNGCCSMLEWSLFKNWLFIIYVCGLSFGHVGYMNLCMFLPPYAAEYGIDKGRIALIMSIIGLSDLIGRVFGGWFADLGYIKRSNIMAICLSVTGVCAVLATFYVQFATLIVLCVIVGMIGGVYVSLMVVVIIDFLGLSKLASGFGLGTMCMGLATIPVPMILGVLKDSYGTFSPAIVICGILMVLGGMFFAIEPVARKLQVSEKT